MPSQVNYMIVLSSDVGSGKWGLYFSKFGCGDWFNYLMNQCFDCEIQTIEIIILHDLFLKFDSTDWDWGSCKKMLWNISSLGFRWQAVLGLHDLSPSREFAMFVWFDLFFSGFRWMDWIIQGKYNVVIRIWLDL